MHLSTCLLAWSQISGCRLELVAEPTRPRGKRSSLPYFVCLFVICYGMMTYLVFEQAKTIESQRNLIQTLFGDSLELTSIKGKQVQERNAANLNAQKQAAEAGPKAPTQNNQKQVAPQSKAKKHNFPKPPQAASDTPDFRRALMSI